MNILKMKKAITIIILLLAIISCEKKENTIKMTFQETGCANPWDNPGKYNVIGSKDPDYQIRIKDFLSQLGIEVLEMFITNDGIWSGCYACFCPTGRKINILIKTDYRSLAEEISFLVN